MSQSKLEAGQELRPPDSQTARTLGFHVRFTVLCVFFLVNKIAISLLGSEWYLRRNKEHSLLWFFLTLICCCLLCPYVLGWDEGRKTYMTNFWPSGVDRLVEGGR